jgi:hypothetical protein
MLAIRVTSLIFIVTMTVLLTIQALMVYSFMYAIAVFLLGISGCLAVYELIKGTESERIRGDH